MASKSFKIPLAWLQLAGDKLRLLAAVSGIVFAVTLMLMQLGFRDALYTAALQIHNRLRSDVVMLSTQYEYLLTTKSFSERYLYQTLSYPEVESVAPLYVGLGSWKTSKRRDLPIFIMGFDPVTSVFDLPEAEPIFGRLKMEDAVFFDEGSKPEYGTFQEKIKRGEKCEGEVSGRRVKITGGFRLGISFASDGNLITSEQGFLRLMPQRKSGIIDIGLIRLKPGVSADAMLEKLRGTLPAGVQVMTRAQYMKYEMNYWGTRTPIGFVFNLGTFVGFLVGAVIVYQILYTDVTDHLGEYATLKAMGYTDRYLCGVVMKEGLILALIGFIPGWIFSTGMGIMTRKITLLPAYMTWQRTLLVLLLTVVMCVGSGVLAMRKVRTADPADIF